MSVADIAAALIKLSEKTLLGNEITESDVIAITDITRLSGTDDVFNFYSCGGVTALCDITQKLGGIERQTEVKLALLYSWQSIATVGQVRTYCLLRKTIPHVAKLCTDALRMIQLEGPNGEPDEEGLLNVHLQAASCLNMIPTYHDTWVKDDIPQLCLMLISQNRDYDNIIESFNGGAVSRLDAGMMLVVNFCGSEDFFDLMLEIGIVEELFLVAREIIERPKYLEGEDDEIEMIIVRYCILLVLFLGIPKSCEMFDELDSKTEPEFSVIRSLLPHLVNNSDNVMIRSLSHQALAIYSKVTTSQHEWITDSIPPEHINEIEPTYSFKRPCHRSGCTNTESAPLKFSYCSICKVPAYCSAICQKGDWKTHKQICKYMSLATSTVEVVKHDDQLD